MNTRSTLLWCSCCYHHLPFLATSSGNTWVAVLCSCRRVRIKFFLPCHLSIDTVVRPTIRDICVPPPSAPTTAVGWVRSERGGRMAGKFVSLNVWGLGIVMGWYAFERGTTSLYAVQPYYIMRCNHVLRGTSQYMRYNLFFKTCGAKHRFGCCYCHEKGKGILRHRKKCWVAEQH